jgi:hypothetical protein
MKLALATCSELPDWEVDDAPFHAALATRGVHVQQPAWDSGCDWSAFDAVLIRTTWDYVARRDAFVAWAHHVASVTRLFNPAPVIEWNTHKGYLRRLARAGAPLAPTLWLDRYDSVQLASVLPWDSGFIKPQVGASASDTLRFTRADLPRAQDHLDALLRRSDVMVQPYLSQVETQGEVSAIYLDGRFSHGVRKVPVPGDYRVQDDYGATDAPHTLTAQERAVCDAVLGLVDEDLLYARVDLMRDDADRIVLAELELVEPSLFFRHGPGAADALADALVRRLSASAAAG